MNESTLIHNEKFINKHHPKYTIVLLTRQRMPGDAENATHEVRSS